MTAVTQWFKPNQKPVHVGAYRTKHPDIGAGYSWWNGKEFGPQFDTPARAYRFRGNVLFAIQEKQWRGLAEESK
jgi:hypothetical protein